MNRSKKSSPYEAVTTRAREFIELHWREDVTLEIIAAHVFMSPFHFQRIFKRETGETPKAYVTRLRIDQAVHILRAYPDKPVYEVALECGFSSQSVFARAIQQKFGISATKLRALSFSAIAKLPVWDPGIRQLLLSQLRKTYSPKERKKFLASITVRRMEPIDIIYIPTTMRSEDHIADTFQTLAARAEVFDLIHPKTEYFGIMYDFPLHTPLEKCRYKACYSAAEAAVIPPKCYSRKIDGRKYAVFPVTGDFEKMIQLALLFFNDWLNASHYKMAKLHWFERFTDLPTRESYSTKVRELYLPIEPA